MHRSDALAPQADWRTPPREPKKRQKLEYGTSNLPYRGKQNRFVQFRMLMNSSTKLKLQTTN